MPKGPESGTGGIFVSVEGLDKAEKDFKRLGQQILGIVGRSLHRSAEAIMGESKERYVPVATGALRGSGHVALPKPIPGGVTVELGFGGPAAPYALSVHENPRSGKTGGVSPQGKPYPQTMGGKATWSQVGQWKYLETPLKAATGRVEQAVHRDIKEALKGPQSG